MKRLVSVCLATMAACAVLWTTLASRDSTTLPVRASAVERQVPATAPMEKPPIESTPLNDSPAAAPPTLFSVTISPEARVNAAAVEGRRELLAGDWTTFQITIENAAGITAPLVIESEQLMLSDSDKDRDHWLRLILEPSGPLTGQTKEVRTLQLSSRDVGIRTALLNVNAGQGTQDLGFRSDVVLSFRVAKKDRLSE